MNFSKLLLIMALSVSLNNVVCGMNSPIHFTTPILRPNVALEGKQDEKSDDNDKKKIYSDVANEQLLIAVSNRKADLNCIKLLLEGDDDGYCADPNINDDRDGTPLYIASYDGKLKIVRLLLEYGADPNIKNRLGWTPLHRAIFSHGNVEIVKLLLSHGANPLLQRNDGWTSLHTAAYSNKKLELVKLLLEHMKNVFSSMETTEKLAFLCKNDANFRLEAETFLLCLKHNPPKTNFKIPKPVTKLMLLDDKKMLEIFVNIKDKKGKTALDVVRESGCYKTSVECIESFKKENGIN